MKKVFAFLSTLLLTIAFVGIFAVSKPASASYKIVEDPTLEADEIPMYIMSSIYTTFPNYYDNEAKADEKWGGPARMYPWNETRLRVTQVDENGEPTGKYYAVYFAGGLKHMENGKEVIGAGQNILFWNVDANGTVITEKQSNGKSYYPGQASDPSLSHARRNISGQDIEIDPLLADYNLAGEGQNYYNRSIVFDAQGRIIRAVGLDNIYTTGEGDYKMAPEYCYVDGVVTKIDENTECDKVLKAVVGEDNEPVFDEEGNPVYEETDEIKVVAQRFVYEYFEEEPTNVNENGYLNEGWDPDLWDYCYPEGDGYICIAFVDNANNAAHTVKGDQITAYVNTLVAQGKTQEEAEALANGKVRECVRLFRIPADGFVFDYGYLDRGTSNDEFFNDTVIKGYKYGRTTITGEQRTYNFSVTGLYYKDQVIDGSSYQLLNNQNVVEIMQGSVINPADQIVYDGVMRYWGTPNDLTSYTASAEALNFYISESVNGAAGITVVQPSTGYTSFEGMKEDFMKDVNAFVAKKNGFELQEDGSWTKTAEDGTVSTYDPVPVPQLSDGINTSGKWYTTLNNEIATNNAAYASFVKDEDMWTKWSWLFEYMSVKLSAAASGFNADRTVPSPGNFTYTMWAFLTESPLISGWPSSKVAWDNGLAREWLDERTNLEKWQQYQIDASMAAPNDNWVVTYKVVNSDTGVSSELTIKYVVVDSYTPIIKVNADKLYYTPKLVSDLVVCDPIDPYQIVTAYDASYNGVDIRGNDITQNVDFDTELDFNNPKEGKWPVVATIYNNAGTKKAVAKFTIQIVDITAPNAKTRKVLVQQGDDFDVRAGIVLAVDNVDGDLTKQAYTWWEEISKPVNTQTVSVDENGKSKDATYTIKVLIFDRTGNEREVSYTLVVVADKFNDITRDAISDIKSNVSDLSTAITDLGDVQDELSESVKELQDVVGELAGLKAEVDSLKTTVAGVKTEVGNVQTSLDDLSGDVEELVEFAGEAEETLGALAAKGCGKNATALVLEIAGAAALLAFVLRKRH